MRTVQELVRWASVGARDAAQVVERLSVEGLWQGAPTKYVVTVTRFRRLRQDQRLAVVRNETGLP